MKHLDNTALQLWREHARAAERSYRDAANCRALMLGRVIPADLRDQLRHDAYLCSLAGSVHYQRAAMIRDRVH